MSTKTPQCLVCEQTNQDVPLIVLTYKDQTLHVCPQHMPVLIHRPHELVGKLDGAENMQAG